MEKKKSKLLTLFYAVLIFYAVFYFFFLTGYLESVQKDKMRLTSEAMKQFEVDISNGKDVSVTDYLRLNQKDYSTTTSRIGNKLGGLIDYTMRDGIKVFVEGIKKLFT